MSKTITCTASAVMASVVKKPAASPAAAAVYSFREPVEKLPWRSHFSSLLLSADWLNTAIELTVLLTLTAMATLLPASRVDVPGSMRLGQLSAFLWAASLTRRVYNAYLEAVFFACPARRTQPPREHALKAESDLCGRDREQLAALVYHDRMTLLSQLTLVLALSATLLRHMSFPSPPRAPTHGTTSHRLAFGTPVWPTRGRCPTCPGTLPCRYYGVPGFYPAFDSRLAGAPATRSWPRSRATRGFSEPFSEPRCRLRSGWPVLWPTTTSSPLACEATRLPQLGPPPPQSPQGTILGTFS